MARKVTKRERELAELVGRLTKDFTIQKTTKGHYRIIIIGPAGSRAIIASSTPSDHREDKNIKSRIALAVVAVSATATAETPMRKRS